MIGIGEATHGTHQDQAFKVELTKSLVRAGDVQALVLECNRTPAAALDDYVRRGLGDPAALVMAPGLFAIYKNDAFGGLLLWLRAWNRSASVPVAIVGIDNQDSGVDARQALDVLARHDAPQARHLQRSMSSLVVGPDGQPRRLAQWLAEADRAQYQAVEAAVTELRDRFADAPPAWQSDPAFAEARDAADTAWQGLYIFERDYRGANPADAHDWAYQGRRDLLMADNLERRLGDRHAVLWAHDMHVASAVFQATGDPGLRPVGTVLRDKLGIAYRAVGFTWSQATVHAVALADSAPLPIGARTYSDIALANDRPGDFGHVFAPLPGNSWWVDLTARPHSRALDRWGARALFHGFAGWRIDTATFQTDPADDMPNPPDVGFDILVWFRAMTPSRSWPEPLVAPH